MSQITPAKLAVQLHFTPCPTMLHSPPFLHGLGSQLVTGTATAQPSPSVAHAALPLQLVGTHTNVLAHAPSAQASPLASAPPSGTST
jgi:hypothetical protein